MRYLLTLFLCLPLLSYGQFVVKFDSSTFSFSAGDSLQRPFRYSFWDSGNFVIDTAACGLWQIGSTTKAGFADSGTTARGLMTDTQNVYTANTNASFVINIKNIRNPGIVIWHRYQTDSLHAGGTIEISTDTGTTWVNIVQCFSVRTIGLYENSDTIFNGIPAFRGSAGSTVRSELRILNCVASKTTSTCSSFLEAWQPLKVRFRFISDSTIDSLSGWMIDSIQVATWDCGSGGIKVTSKKQWSVSPNPAGDQMQISGKEDIDDITVFDVTGRTVISQRFHSAECTLSTHDLLKGWYLLKVNNIYTEPFLKE